VEQVLPSLQNPNPNVRSAGVERLAALRDIGAIGLLVSALNDDHTLVRRKAVEALGEFGDSRGIEMLGARLDDEDEDPKIREEAAWALAKFRHPEATKRVAPTLARWAKEYSFRSAPAVEALSQMKDPAVASILVRQLPEDFEADSGTLRALRGIGAPAIVGPLVQAMNNREYLTRTLAAELLGEVRDARAVEPLMAAARDEDKELRRAAIEALLWDCEKRWSWIRYAVRRVMADPLFITDGPLIPDGQVLSAEAVKDLTGWCAEKGTLSARAAQTLAAHYHRALTERVDPQIIRKLRETLADPHAPAILRLELGKLLQAHRELDADLLASLVDSANPGSLRLIACETILADHADKPILRSLAASALKDLARLSNRELALATADVVQRRLGVDLGLGLGQPLPALHSRQATDITRRVMRWANQFDEAEELEKSGR